MREGPQPKRELREERSKGRSTLEPVAEHCHPA